MVVRGRRGHGHRYESCWTCGSETVAEDTSHAHSKAVERDPESLISCFEVAAVVDVMMCDENGFACD